MGTKPELSVITVNYNGYGDTVALIDSLRKYLADIPFEAIVVDNASRTDEAGSYPPAFSGRGAAGVDS